jgi:hypothetical protein
MASKSHCTHDCTHRVLHEKVKARAKERENKWICKTVSGLDRMIGFRLNFGYIRGYRGLECTWDCWRTSYCAKYSPICPSMIWGRVHSWVNVGTGKKHFHISSYPISIKLYFSAGFWMMKTMTFGGSTVYESWQRRCSTLICYLPPQLTSPSWKPFTILGIQRIVPEISTSNLMDLQYTGTQWPRVLMVLGGKLVWYLLNHIFSILITKFLFQVSVMAGMHGKSCGRVHLEQ